MSRPTAIKVQEFAVPLITDADQRAIDRGYRAFFARRGVNVDASQSFGGRFMTAAQRQQYRAAMAAMFEDNNEGRDE